MGMAPQPQMPAPPQYADPPSPEPTKKEPWGQEDPLLWSAARARIHAIWGSTAIALFVLLFGVGMYVLFTAAIYEGDIEGNPSLILLLLSPFLLAIIGAVAAGAMARNVGRMSKQPLAPAGAGTARGILWLSVFLWIMLLIVFPLSLTVTTEPDNPDNDPFPIGILTVLPVYIGLCLAVYATGASYAAWSRDNKVECMLIIGLAWAAFAMFLLLPAVIGSWNLGSEDPDVSWDSAVWWLRFGSLFPAIAPWLIVFGLYFVHNRSISLIEEDLEGEPLPPPPGASMGTTSADSCPSCGGNLSVHPKTLEVFCGACGWGLRPEVDGPVMADPTPAPTHMDDLFVERTPAPVTVAGVPSAAAPTDTTSPDPGYCGDCGNKLSVLTKTHLVYCPACGAGLPGTRREQAPPIQTQQASPPVQTQVPAPLPATSPEPVQEPPIQPYAPPTSPAPVAVQERPSPGNCPICGAMLAVHPRTGERFCPACGAGLRPEQ